MSKYKSKYNIDKELAEIAKIKMPDNPALLPVMNRIIGFSQCRSDDTAAVTRHKTPGYGEAVCFKTAVQIICAFFVYGVSAFFPGVMGVLKYAGAAYILYLAVHIAVSRPAESQEGNSASFTKSFLLQFVNVKIYMFGITALTGWSERGAER